MLAFFNHMNKIHIQLCSNANLNEIFVALMPCWSVAVYPLPLFLFRIAQ